MLSDPKGSEQELEQMLEEARQHQQWPQEALALCLLSGCHFFQGDYRQSVKVAQEALRVSRQAGQRSLEARCLNSLGLATQRLGRFDEALDHLTQSLLIVQSQEDDAGRCRVMNNIALVHLQTRSYATAIELGEESRRIALAGGHVAYACDAGGNLIEGYFYQGDYPKVLRLAAELIPVLSERRMLRYECSVRTFLARTLLALDQGDTALGEAQAGLQAIEQTNDAESLSIAHLTLGRVYLHLRQYGHAKENLNRALHYSQTYANRLMQSDVYSLLSQVLEAEGNYREALEHARVFHERESALQSKDVDYRVGAIAAQARMEVLRREAEVEHIRNLELEAVNSALRETQSALAYQATHDALTGLVNRRTFYEQVLKELERTTQGAKLALLFIDLDQFKDVNDVAGHQIGDQVIHEVARRLNAAVRLNDLVGRIGGDEFTVLLRDVSGTDETEFIAQRLLDSLSSSIEVNGQKFRVTASVGCALAPEDGDDLQTLQRHAELAMSHAKWAGKNVLKRFDEQMSVTERERRNLERDLQQAIRLNQLSVHYQGQFILPHNKLAGFEALLRWNHPTLGMVPPDRFIPLAEEGLLILEIGEWVLREACQQAAAWNFAKRNLFTSVNVSAVQFDQPNFVETVKTVLEDTGLPGPCLVLELTESMVLRDSTMTVKHIQELNKLGVHVAVDDFGTGYSSLSVLQNLPFVHLKIDRTFVNSLTESTQTTDRAYMLMQVMIQMAHSLNMYVVAEGVETPRQHALLCALGCDKAQGYYLSRPIPPQDAAKLLPSP